MKPGWTVTRVGDVAQQVRGVTYSKGDATKEHHSGLIAVLRAGNITGRGLTLDDLVYVPAGKVSAAQRLKHGDVLIAASSGSLEVVGKAARVEADLDAAFGAFCKVLRPSPEVDDRFFGHYFQTPNYRRTISLLAAGANINNLRSGDLDNLEFPLPPLDEQRRIAAVLDHVDALRTRRYRTFDELALTAQAYLIQTLSSGVQPTPLSTLVEEFRYGTSEKSAPTGLPTLRIPNVVGATLDLTEIKTVPVDLKVRDRLVLRDGDLLFVRTNGNPDYVGRSAVYARSAMESGGFDPDSTIFASYLIRARFAEDGVDPAFVQSFLSSSEGRRRLRSNAKTSAGQYNINIDGLGSTMIDLPSIADQREFAGKLARVDALRGAAQRHLTELDTLFSSLQARAFAGELELSKVILPS